MNFGNAFRIAAVVCLGAARVITAVLGDRETQSLINSNPIPYNGTPYQPNFNFYDTDSRRGNVQYVQPVQVPVYQCYPTQQYVAPQPVQQYAPVQAPVQQYVQPQQVQVPVPMVAPTTPQAYTVPSYPQQMYGYDNFGPYTNQPVNNYQAPVYQQPTTYPTYQNVNYAQPQYPMNNYQYQEQQRQYEIQEQQRRQQLRMIWDEQARRGMSQQAYQSMIDDPVPVTFLEKVKRRFNLPDGIWETMSEEQRMAMLSNAPDLQAHYAPISQYNCRERCTQQQAYACPSCQQQTTPKWMNISFDNGVSSGVLNDNPWWNQYTGNFGNTIAPPQRSPEYDRYIWSL